jgi:hypothetical protein
LSVQAKLNGIADFAIEMTLPDMKAGEVIKFVAQKGDKARVAVGSDAALVHYFPLDQPHAHESLNGSQIATPFC